MKIHGFRQLAKKIVGLTIYKIKRRLNKKNNKRVLNAILKENNKKQIIVFYSPVPWNLPLYQRPHHLALQLANLDFLYFYCTNNPVKDRVNGFKKVSDNCYITDQGEQLFNLENKKVIQLYSTDIRDNSEIYEKAKKNKDCILYEYIDELHEDITGEIPNFVFTNHYNILEDEENCKVIASADKLINDVKQRRSKNFKLVTNGVDVNHFRVIEKKVAPREVQTIVKRKKPIIGYFGAFASWFDYELIKKLAKERSEYEILLIGWDYDNSISKYNLDVIANIHVIGPINYGVLPNYAQFFDVSIIPFKINEVTESTSPVKLFEYMAMGKPIVTTDMVECRKYKSVLIGKNEENFIKQIDKALSLCNDNKYLGVLRREADENNWLKKAKEIEKALTTSN